MNILLISECDKKALVNTRRLLDQFAERRGERTWQTPITQAGLDTLRKLLRQSARKNTAVACHWIRGLDHSELLWVVGDRSRFNAQGAVPTNTTRRSILCNEDEDDWRTGDDIRALTALAALMHDLGKASIAFQEKLIGVLTEANQYRHEWVSLRLFEAFVGKDDDATWLNRLINPAPQDDQAWTKRLQQDGTSTAQTTPFKALAHAPLAQAIGWLIVTHHRLPTLPVRPDSGQPYRYWGQKVDAFGAADLQNPLLQVTPAWNNKTPAEANADTAKKYWTFQHGLPVTTPQWRTQAAKWAKRLLGKTSSVLDNPYVMHLARLSLMLADHRYSSLGVDAQGQPEVGRIKGEAHYPLFANTYRNRLNQTLDEHLLGVAKLSGRVTRALPLLNTLLPRLAQCKPLKKRTQDARFQWQNKAAEQAEQMREHSAVHGAFIVNMASTGCGKTLANARIMYALADPDKGMRCAFAMGLRTLTLQTGRAFRDLLNVGDEHLAIRVGGTASRALFEHYEQQAEHTGSVSQLPLMEESDALRFPPEVSADAAPSAAADDTSASVIYDGDLTLHPFLASVLDDPNIQRLLVAPLLVCTIDHLTPATESARGGRQIAPMLRLLSGDLVLDEPDDFDISDLPALTRLVHWAGLLGARVLLSSATLPPALVQGLFRAYLTGRTQFARNRGPHHTPLADGSAPVPEVYCLWVDEFEQHPHRCSTHEQFAQAHAQFAEQRIKALALAPVRRRAELIPLNLKVDVRHAEAEQARAKLFAQQACTTALKLHDQHHSRDPRTGKRVSFGLIRMANIEPLVKVALALYRDGVPQTEADHRIHLCVYHSQYPLLLRSEIEHQLDQALNRRDEFAVFNRPDIRQRLDDPLHTETHHLFIVLGSPVTEVGRDHDYDWAVVEPSSMRSLIQLAGRVRRHRITPCDTPNIAVFATNWRHWKNLQKNKPDDPAFCKPGFETNDVKLNSHDLHILLSPEQREVIDARPRLKAPPLPAQMGLVDLEHWQIKETMAYLKKKTMLLPKVNAASWWKLSPEDALLTGLLPQEQPFRDQSGNHETDFVLSLNEDGDDYELHELMDVRQPAKRTTTIKIASSKREQRIDLPQGPRIAPWNPSDYIAALHTLAQQMDIPPAICAQRFGTISLKTYDKPDTRWRFHPALGFSHAKE
jgi:CRISPR-associated endonuclease/helicase Cas3